jgi:multiple sugar transport system permease protein
MRKLFFYVIVGIIVFLSLLPFLWFVDTSLKSTVEVTSIPPVLVPSGSLHFYQSGIEQYELLHYVKNSIIVAGMTTLVTIIISIFAGYALARLRMRFKGLMLGGLLILDGSIHIRGLFFPM